MNSSKTAVKRIKVILADDHPLFRKAVREILEEDSDVVVIGEAEDGEQAVSLVIKLIPDLVIMDITMPKLNGLEATRQIKNECPNVAILVLTVHDDIEHILGILEAGAAGYLTKNASEREIIATIHAVIAGEKVISTDVFNKVLKHTIKYSIMPVPLPINSQLTTREMQVLRLAAKGLGNKEISHKLCLSTRTIKSYMMSVFTKLSVSSRTEAVIISLRSGLITPEDII